ncbi:hypothetical protein [Puia dinghuensis]|uniref:Uncharacterized protein n=1 Tax=Puia dinghuensis TaxID=1792502 RepID=A0A8J2UC25_9BACT|nr:hypothetical protein [Puia dinghuensis]GGA95842.1 hypothetical protein GCM10011511_18900 [Puia dinghuensis]
MNRIYTLLTLALIVLSTNTNAAANGRDSLLNGETPAPKAQAWEKTPDLINGHIAHDKLSSMKNRTQALIRLLQDSCFNTGAAVWHGEYFSGRSLSGSLLKFAAQCSFYGQEKTDGTKADLLILANDLSPLLGHYTINDNYYFTIKANVTSQNGCLYFQQPQTGTSFWLITADNTNLPYLPVTRKEYLIEARKELIRDTTLISTEWRNKITIRPAAEQEAEKQQELQQLKTLYSGMELEARKKIYLQHYTSDETFLQQTITKATALQCSTLHLIDSLLLNTGAAQLDRPAIIAGQDADPNEATTDQGVQPTTATPGQAAAFNGFADGQPGATMLVKANPACFNPSLSEEKPQFFLVGWRFDPNEPLASDLDRQLRANFDGQKLKEMLGK